MAMNKRIGNLTRTAADLVLLVAASTAWADPHAEARFKGTGKADPVRITSVQCKPAGVAGAGAIVFDLAWDWSWRAAWEEGPEQHGGAGKLKIENWDAAWVFVKFRKPGSKGWSHATLSSAAGDHRVPAEAVLVVGLTDDGKRGTGVFIYRSKPGSGPNNWKGVTLRWLHGEDGVPNVDQVSVPQVRVSPEGPGEAVAPKPHTLDIQVCAINMVYVPRGAFWAGDGATNSLCGDFSLAFRHLQPRYWNNGTANCLAGHFTAGGTTAPFRVASEEAITLGGESTSNLNNSDGIGMDFMDDFNRDWTQQLPASFPKGYAAFYCMKHELTQGQYVEFLNTLSFELQDACTMSPVDAAPGTATSVTSSDKVKEPWAGHSGVKRNGIRITVSGVRASATPAVYETVNPHVACNNLCWPEVAAYAAWAGLRPMTELEYEKACRGPLKPVPHEYGWGTTGIVGMNAQGASKGGYTLRDPGKPDEFVTWSGDREPDATCGSAVWYGTAQAIAGPVRVGVFATLDSDRVRSGASYWGIMELSGNLEERLVSVSDTEERAFTGAHGDGAVPSVPGRPGRPVAIRIPGWPAESHGSRGGSWMRDHKDALPLRVSDRSGGYEIMWRGGCHGFRCVRTAPKPERSTVPERSQL